ncbi:C69 family dipeptidase [Desulfobacula sp.]|uniref:C69 family dipeptidase n=1 Tax=Desulfobacula sp. TaxID=2593537 RepID=UPI002620892B|nr:C69 family dipeptidase [Desulfobacula sp.]
MCDTFVAVSNATEDRSVIFGKNSDREPNEAQCLEYHPPEKFSKNQKLDCTYLSIPQVKETYGVLLCRPFWMWGAEMGANEKGLVIGNEAVFTKMPIKKTHTLTGMDLLRLALERASTAQQGMEVITGLLADLGQGGACGYEDKNLFYHNSYILADKNEAWVLETSGPFWVALKIKDVYSISNGLTIGEEFDKSHPGLIENARQKGWLKKGQTFNFAKCYSDWLFTFFSASGFRRKSSYDLLETQTGKIDVSSAFRILRSHKGKEYKPASHFLMDSVCAHAGNGLTRNSGTTGSLVAHLSAGSNTFWATGTAGPCTGIFKPIWLKEDVLPDSGPLPKGIYDPETLWWQHEKLHRSVLKDYSRMSLYKEERDQMEIAFFKKASDLKEKSRIEITSQAFAQSRTATENWISRVESQPAKRSLNPVFNLYWKKQNKKAGLTLA